MWTFRKMLDLANENKIYVWGLMVASSVECVLEAQNIEVDDETFEALCKFICNWEISFNIYEIISLLIETLTEVKENNINSEYIYDNWDDIEDRINGRI